MVRIFGYKIEYVFRLRVLQLMNQLLIDDNSTVQSTYFHSFCFTKLNRYCSNTVHLSH